MTNNYALLCDLITFSLQSSEKNVEYGEREDRY